MSSQLMSVFDSIKDQIKDAIWALTSCMCQSSAKVKINGRSFKILRVLGEGGFSFVYLAEDEHSHRQFALKKIRCPAGSESVKEVLREVEAYRRFKHPNIIRILDFATVQDQDGEGKVVYLFLPLYKRGNLQDAINSHSINGTRFSEKDMLRLFRGTCEAVQAMHDYRAPLKQASSAPQHGASSSRPQNGHADGNLSDDEEDANFPQPEGDAEDGYSYEVGGKSAASVPLVSKWRKQQQQRDVVFDSDDAMESSSHNLDPSQTENVPYAHRDLKPGNVMISDDGSPILMDFGSTVKARVAIENRQQALSQQDLAAEQSTMAYRAPELFDVKTGVTLDEKVDIWSLGCTLFALAYLHSPFENPQTTEQGGSMAMAVMNGQYKQPNSSSYSQGFKDLIDSMLTVDPAKRPDIHRVINMTDRVLQTLN